MRGRILITGGTGFLGRGILRAAVREKWDAEFTVFSRDEFKQHLCRDKYPRAAYYLGDVRDTDRLTLLMRGHDIVIHAAALKYVVEAEQNVDECVGINVYGTQSVIKAAHEAGVACVVNISTDKAVEPLNTYGLTKAIGERLFYEASGLMRRTKFVTCRYGNVIGSTGSVLPVFKHQYNTLGYVQVTDPDMTRFWLNIDQAVKLIQIAAMQMSGTVLVPTALQALSIGEIAEAIAGTEISVIGARPGEKIHEKLAMAGEVACSVPDTLFDVKYMVYFANSRIIRESVRAISSADAVRMPVEEFLAAAQDAELV